MVSHKKSYQIAKGCVSCGACKVVCPVHCIQKGQPYRIDEKKCIGCGLCVTRCWRQVIYKNTDDKNNRAY